jgi:hypothetical protein
MKSDLFRKARAAAPAAAGRRATIYPIPEHFAKRNTARSYPIPEHFAKRNTARGYPIPEHFAKRNTAPRHPIPEHCTRHGTATQPRDPSGARIARSGQPISSSAI